MPQRALKQVGRSIGLGCLMAVSCISAGCQGTPLQVPVASTPAAPVSQPAAGPYGVPGGGPAYSSPKTAFYGVSGEANRIVYLVDCSGSMIGVFGDVKQRLKQTILTLPDTPGAASFDVIAFSDEKEPRAFSKTLTGSIRLVDSTPANKRKVFDFIDSAVASGGTQPIPAVHAVFGMSPRPQLIYVLTDGFDNAADFDAVIEEFKDGTADGKTKVNCVQFVNDPDPKLTDVLQTIARNGHGEFKQISKSEMQ